MQKKKKLKDIFSSALDFPSGLGKNDSRIEMIAKKCVLIRGCLGIIEYGDKRMSFRIKEGMVNIEGEGLYCTAYTSDAVEISGEIISVAYGEVK